MASPTKASTFGYNTTQATLVTVQQPQAKQQPQQQQQQQQQQSYPQPQFFTQSPTRAIDAAQLNLQQLTGWTSTPLSAEVSSLFLQPASNVAQVVTSGVAPQNVLVMSSSGQATLQPTVQIQVQAQSSQQQQQQAVPETKPKPKRVRKRAAAGSSASQPTSATIDGVVEQVAQGFVVGDTLSQVRPSAPPPGSKTSDVWQMVGVFDNEADMQKERLAQKVSKRKVNCMKTGYKVTYRCNSWRRLGCRYSMYAIHNKDDGRITLHERGVHIHPLTPNARKHIFAANVCHFGTVTGVDITQSASPPPQSQHAQSSHANPLHSHANLAVPETKPKRVRASRAKQPKTQQQQQQQQQQLGSTLIGTGGEMKPAVIVHDDVRQPMQLSMHVQHPIQLQMGQPIHIQQLAGGQHIQLAGGQPLQLHNGTTTMVLSPQTPQFQAFIQQCFQQQQPAHLVIASQSTQQQLAPNNDQRH